MHSICQKILVFLTVYNVNGSFILVKGYAKIYFFKYFYLNFFPFVDSVTVYTGCFYFNSLNLMVYKKNVKKCIQNMFPI